MVRDEAGHLRIAALPSANAGLVPRALAELRARYPEIAVSLVEAGPEESWSLLLGAECDLAVTFDHPLLASGRRPTSSSCRCWTTGCW